ncbi:hypothetical protein IQ254_11110 [Nodosilinea sp. LEGE 07088]|uniref:hypothetical protein n=1 Tax=Nodosilinea sp. LEGE 07088 TaxID=2777968 RepID=UPI00187E2EFC|nr:hypothetical protein [Nodosilinea sp. LEGE 07088]MBE9137734.1 hypothetical protein [Nodosilinea sp. LEGE 07088]
MNVPKWVLVAAISATWGLTSATAAPAQSTSGPGAIIQGIVDFFRDDDVDDRGRGAAGGSRPAATSMPYCVVNPGKNETLWSLQPLFVLQQGETERVEEIAVRPRGETAIFWSAPVLPAASDNQQIYAGPPLQPGVEYEWLFYTTFLGEVYVDFSLSFRVMAEGAERDRITTELAQLQSELAATAADESEQAIAIAAYFFDNDLLADALQFLFSVNSPSEDLLATRETLVEAICSQPLAR